MRNAVQDDERQPLLAPRSDERSCGWCWPGRYLDDDSLRKRIPTYLVLLVALLMYSSYTGPLTASFEQTRALACAEYYQHHPPSSSSAAVASNARPAQRLCDNDWIEGRSAQVLSIARIVGGLATSALVALFQPQLRKWGRKRLFLITIALMSVDRITNVFLPVGYPYRSRCTAADMPITPVWAMRFWLAASCLSNALGSETVQIMCLRMIITEVASAAGNKTSALLGLLQMSWLSLILAPPLTTAIGVRLNMTSSDVANLFFRHSQPTANKLPIATSPQQQLNVGPFVVSIATIVATMAVAIVLLPPDRHPSSPPTATIIMSPITDKNPEPLFWRLWPRKDIDGKRDWRITLVMLVAVAHMSSAYSINIFLQFFGHTYRWPPESVALLVSALGAMRMVTLFFLTPLFTAVFERTTTRPMALRHLTVAQLRSMQEQPTDAGENEVGRGDDSHADRYAITVWRARVDRGVLAVSLGFDLVGWSLIALFTLLDNKILILVASMVVALGVAAVAVRMGVDLAIVTDVLARTSQVPKEPHAHGAFRQPESDRQHVQAKAAELYFSLLGVFDSISACLSPLITTALYKRTLSTAPAANWVLSSTLFAVAIAIHFSMTVHKKSLD